MSIFFYHSFIHIVLRLQFIHAMDFYPQMAYGIVGLLPLLLKLAGRLYDYKDCCLFKLAFQDFCYSG